MVFLLVACISSCNKDGLTTLVIEDGQPSVAQMIIGQWTPDHVEWADEDGNVLERPEMPDIPDLNFDEGGTGTFGGNGSGSFDWTVDEGLNDDMGSGYHGEGPSITFGGERWYIFQLTKTILIIYRITDRYIIIYYYDRVGEYNGGNDEGPSVEPVDKCPYQPYEGERIVKIMEVGNQVTYKYEQVYLYEYDEKNRISSFSVGENEDNIYWTWSYKYDEEKVTACKLAKEAGADFVKTSTGFSKWGAKKEDIELMRKAVGPEMGVKASGGISNFEEMKQMIDAGATRIGTSRGVTLMEEAK